MCVPPALMAPSGPRPGMQQQEGWVGPASAPPIGAPGPGHQNAIQGRTGPSGTPMRPNSQPGPRQMMQSPIMPNSKSAVYQKKYILQCFKCRKNHTAGFQTEQCNKAISQPLREYQILQHVSIETQNKITCTLWKLDLSCQV